MPVIYGRQDAAAAMPLPDAAYCAERNLHEIIGTVSGLHTSSTLVMIARVLVRVFMTKSFGSDDWCMLVAWFMSLATFICWIGEKPYAIGRHIECIDPHQFRMHSKWQYYHSLWVMIGVVLVKVSIALFLMRLVPPGKRWKQGLWAAIVFLICFMLTCAGTLIWQCVPVAAAWDSALRAAPGTKCWSNSQFMSIGLFNSSVNCITDFLFAILPIPIIIKLQINLRTKITLAVILSFGYVACAAGIVKAVKQHSFFDEKDPFWHNSFNVWNYVELCVGIMAGSLPALKPLFASLLSGTKSLVQYPFSNGSRHRTTDKGFVRHDESGSTQNDDVKLEDWTDAIRDSPKVGRAFQRSSKRSSAKVAHSRGDSNATLSRTISMQERPYTVTVSSGAHVQETPREDDEWETIDLPGSSQSKERLHTPAPEIHKNVEIFSTSQQAV